MKRRKVGKHRIMFLTRAGSCSDPGSHTQSCIGLAAYLADSHDIR